MPLVLVAIGSNIDPVANIRKAIKLARQALPVQAVSRFYLTPAIGPDGKPSGRPDFINGVLKLQTDEPPESLRRSLRLIEAGLGRKRTADTFAARTIDLDVIVWGDRVEDGIPDPDLATLPHLYVPARDVAPKLVIPGTTTALGGLPEPGLPVVAELDDLASVGPADAPTGAPSSRDLADLARRRGPAKQAGGHGRR